MGQDGPHTGKNICSSFHDHLQTYAESEGKRRERERDAWRKTVQEKEREGGREGRERVKKQYNTVLCTVHVRSSYSSRVAL